MRQFRNIAVNAFMELIRQPIFLLLMTGSVLFEIFLAVPYYFAFGDEMKLVKTSALAAAGGAWLENPGSGVVARAAYRLRADLGHLQNRRPDGPSEGGRAFQIPCRGFE